MPRVKRRQNHDGIEASIGLSTSSNGSLNEHGKAYYLALLDVIEEKRRRGLWPWLDSWTESIKAPEIRMQMLHATCKAKHNDNHPFFEDINSSYTKANMSMASF